MADTLRLMLTYGKQHPIPEGPGQRLGMSQAHAHQWIHLLHTVLNQALAQQERLPARTAAECATLLPRKHAQEAVPSPLLGLMVRSDPSIARGMPKRSQKTTVASRGATRSKPSLGSMRRGRWAA
jgi:hypothetical protein